VGTNWNFWFAWLLHVHWSMIAPAVELLPYSSRHSELLATWSWTYPEGKDPPVLPDVVGPALAMMDCAAGGHWPLLTTVAWVK
jgi:hypothetical protein